MDDILKTGMKSFVRALGEYLPREFYEAICNEIRPMLEPDEFSGICGQKPVNAAETEKILLLRPVFQHMKGTGKGTGKGSEDQKAKPEYSYPLQKLGPESIFPQNLPLKKADYDQLLKDFKNTLPKLQFRKTENHALWFENLESLIMLYASCFPASGNSKDADISLYDYARIQSSFAVADVAYKDTEGDCSSPRYLLISGGISGIQSFIFQSYGESRKYRSKLLRGRSFAVSLISELAADMLCREMGLPFLSVILNAAGRFTILAPDTEKTVKALDKVQKKIAGWLFLHTCGETHLSLSWQEAGSEDFTPEGFPLLWDAVEKKKESAKFRKIDLEEYGGAVPTYLKGFNEFGMGLCPLCGKRPAEAKKDNLAACRMCLDHIHLGENLVKEIPIAVLDAGKTGAGKLRIPFFDEYQIIFGDIPEELPGEAIRRYWDLNREAAGDVAVKFINGYIPRCTPEHKKYKEMLSDMGRDEAEQIREGNPMTLNLIALMAKEKIRADRAGEADTYRGVDALGVLKADVDDLGLLMACGLEERFSLPRVSTLSRQMNLFFALYLPHLLEKGNDRFKGGYFRDVYTVFAGGDDLFLIGPWNRIIDLCVEIRKEFDLYVCKNPDIHFSGGISFHKAHTPIDHMAAAAESELEKSKSCEGKDRLTLFGETVRWEDMDSFEDNRGEMETLRDIRGQMETWLDDADETINQAMLFRVNELMQMAAKEKLLTQKQAESFQDMSCAKWPSLLAYTVARNAAKKAERDKRAELTDEVAEKLYHWIHTCRSKLKIPVWQILYNRR
ncbi:MAG: type III-A CRISPR-associated protein Cas10/Csm1 [Desulfococcaceae bacterium]